MPARSDGPPGAAFLAPTGSATPPTRASIGLPTLAGIGVAFGLARAAASGILDRGEVYAQPALRDAFLANDVIDLAVVAPLLVVAALAARRGSWLATLAWPGISWLVVYVAFPYVLALPRGGLWLAYLALFTASAYLAAAGVASLDGPAVRRRLDGAVPARAIGGTLAALGVSFLALAVATLVASASRGDAAAPSAAVFAADLLVSPAWIVGGVALFRRTAFGYAVALGLLTQLALAFLAVVTVVAVTPLVSGGPLATTDLGVLAAMALIAAVPLVVFARGVVRAGGASR
jgi:hypothetical protein